MSAQLDLFGEVADQQRAAYAAARSEWRATFTQEVIPCPWDTQGGHRKGDPVLAWVCPSCGEHELSTYGLSTNHGYHPDLPGHEPYWGSCHRRRQRIALLVRDAT